MEVRRGLFLETRVLRGRRPLSGLPESYSIAFWRVVVAQGLSSYCETAVTFVTRTKEI